MSGFSPVISTVTVTNSAAAYDTAVNFTFSSRAEKVLICARGSNAWRLAHTSGQVTSSTGSFISIRANAWFSADSAGLPAGTVFYLAHGGGAGTAETFEIASWIWVDIQ